MPQGYSWHVVVAWGDPMWSKGSRFNHTTRGSGASQELSFGDNNDGMAFFNVDGHSLLAVNNEYVKSKNNLWESRKRSSGKMRTTCVKAKQATGSASWRFPKKWDRWSIVQDSSFNRRITADTPMEITGPARGHDLLKTAADPSGTQSLGTWNNCGNGHTPWGTYLTCEENFNEYFLEQQSRSRIVTGNEALRHRHQRQVAMPGPRLMSDSTSASIPMNRIVPGYIVEIDPADPTSIPKKRTALGRFKHENVEVVVAKNGHVVAYSGDDERGEFLYKFISRDKYSEGGNNAELLADGRAIRRQVQ